MEIRDFYKRGIFEWAQHKDFYPHKNQILETWIKKFGWMKLWESQTLVWPRSGKTLNTITTKFWYIRYILRLEKDQELKIVE